jgi:hypothetical protein
LKALFSNFGNSFYVSITIINCQLFKLILRFAQFLERILDASLVFFQILRGVQCGLLQFFYSMILLFDSFVVVVVVVVVPIVIFVAQSFLLRP